MQTLRAPEPVITTKRGAPVRPRFTWDYVHSQSFDWTFFLAPFWISIVYGIAIALLPKYEMAIFLAQYVLLAETHFASTWLIFLDPVNRGHYREHKLVYYYIPLAIMAASIALSLAVDLKLVILFAAAASAVHVMRQSTGILALYRRRIGDRSQERRKYDNLAIYSASITFLIVGAIRFYLNPGMLPASITSAFPLELLTIAAKASVVLSVAVTLYFISKVIKLERLYVQDGNPFSFSRGLVFIYSLFLYAPYVFASRMEHAIAMGVGIHYVQYLGIVWWLNRNKYGTIKGSNDWGLNVLGLMGRSVWIRLPYLVGYGILMLLMREHGLSDWSSMPQSILYAIPIGLQCCHYHLDAYLWRFSNQYVRDTVLKYL